MKPLLQLKKEVFEMGLKAYDKGKIEQAPLKDVYSPWYGRKEEYIEAKSAFY